MSLPFVGHGNIYFVPIIRQRLNFAVLVQRAVDELKLDEQDLVAVEMPMSVSASVQTAIEKLPKVSLVIASLSGWDQREVFPVTPCDGIVEAVRIATERGIPLQYIDQEVAPGNLVDRHCMSDPNWPDDSLALEQGAEWYLNLIHDHLAYPPARLDPVDTWRETHMAEQLRRLHPLHRRILFVCDATHVNPIRRLLREPSLVTDFRGDALPIPKLEVWDPGLSTLLRYLDDIPKLAEIYEQHRAKGNAKDFNKSLALLETIRRLDEEADDVHFSTRHYQAFAQLLAKMMELKHRISPSMEHIQVASTSCFNKPFAERIRRHLLGYSSRVNVERVGRNLSTGEELYVLRSNVEDSNEMYVARSCNPIQHEYEIVPLIEINAVPRLAPDTKNSCLWPPYKDFVRRMRKKTYDLARRGDARIRISQFQGLLKDGIDLRRTLRSCLEPMPRIYVATRLSPRVPNTTRGEPIVWLFEPEEVDQPKCRFEYTWFGLKGGPRFVAKWEYRTERVSVYESKDKEHRVDLKKVKGMASFCDPGVPLQEIRSEFGAEFEQRIPGAESVGEYEGLGLVPTELADRARAGSPWWELLLLGALRYAKETVLCVSPAQFSIPREIAAMAATEGKALHRISLSSFTQDEHRQLMNEYSVPDSFGFPPTEDGNSIEWMGAIIERYDYIMQQFWG